MISLKAQIKELGIDKNIVSIKKDLFQNPDYSFSISESINNFIKEVLDSLRKFIKLENVAISISPNVDKELRRRRIQILNTEIKRNKLPNDYAAYVLATAQLETDHWRTLEEYHDGSDYEWRQDLGNIYPGDGVKFKGRGYVQLTGRTNYQKYTNLFRQGFFGEKYQNIDLISTPNIARDNEDIAALIAVHGMMNGTYTTIGLPNIRRVNGKIDFVQARTIVNGTDRNYEIAGFADKFYKALN